MRAWQAKAFGNPLDVLELIDMDLPDPPKGCVEIKVSHAGVGLPDVLMVNGNYPAVAKPPVHPGQEVVGTVTRCGPEARVKEGEKILASTLFAQGSGGFAEYCLAPAMGARTIPAGMPDEQAAGFWIPFHTGYVGVIQRGNLQPGETLLVLGGSGSSGQAAIQLGKAMGATVIATATTPEKAKFCTSLGADHVINVKEQAIHHGIRDITGDRGVDMIFDPVGGEAYAQAVKGIARHGRVILIGYGSGEWAQIDPLNAVLRSYSLIGAFPGARSPEETDAHHAELVAMAEAGKIRVPVDKVFSFEQVPQALDRVAKGEMLGKVVVKVS